MWTLGILYDSGKQWGFLAEQSGNIAVKMLPKVMGPYEEERTRLTLNLIRGYREKFVASTNPSYVAARAMGRHSRTGSYPRTCTRLMDELVLRERVKDRYCDANFNRHVVGSAGLKLTLRRVASGELPSYAVGCKSMMPWQVLRDPNAKTLHPELDEERIGYEEAVTLDGMKQAYGWAPGEADVSTNMGTLLNFQDSLMSARGMGNQSGPLLADSKVKGVMCREFYLKDPDKTEEIFRRDGIEVPWPWMFVGYSGTSSSDRNDLHPIPSVGDQGLVENPFGALPMFFWHFDPTCEGMWAQSLGWILMQGQDIHNSAISWWFEALNQCFPKWSWESGTIDPGKEGSVLNTNPRKGIVWRRKNQNASEPKRIPGVQLPQVVAETVAMAPTWMQRSLNLSEIQMGGDVKRDVSGKAYDTLIQEAETVIESRISRDEGELGRFLHAMLCTEIRMATVDQLRQTLGPDIPQDAVNELKRQDPAKMLKGVDIFPTTLRPKTSDQTEQHFISLATGLVIPPQEAILEVLLQTGRPLNTALKNSLENEAANLDRMLQGEMVEPEVTDHHNWHAEACQRFLDNAMAQDLPEEVRGIIRQHYILHLHAQATMQGMTAPPDGASQPGQPSPPSGPLGQPAMGSAGPALSVA